MCNVPLNRIKESIMLYPAEGQAGTSVRIKEIMRRNH